MSDALTYRVDTIRRHGRPTRAIALGVVALLLLAACGGDDTNADGGDCDEVIVGVIMSTSGAFSQLGTEGEIAVKAFSSIHREVLGKPLRFEIENDRSDPTASAEAAQRFTSDSCLAAVMGPSVTATMVSAFPRLQSAQIPVIVNTPVPYPGYNEEPFIFSPNLTPIPMQMQDFIDYFDALGATNPVVVTGDDATGDAVEELYTANDVDVERVPLGVTNYEPVLADLRDEDRDAVGYVGSGGQPPGHIARGLEAIGWDVPFVLSPSGLTRDFMNLSGEVAEGVRGFIWPAGIGPDYFGEDPEQQEAVQEIVDAVPGDVDLALQPNIAYIWDNAKALYLAIDEADTTDHQAVRDVLEEQTFWGANGEVVRTPDDHAGVQEESSRQAIVENGELVVWGE